MNTPAEAVPTGHVTISEIAQFTAWLRRLSATGLLSDPGAADGGELAAFAAAKAQLLARIEDQPTHTGALNPARGRCHPHSCEDIT